MPQTKRRRNRKPSILSHACRVEALEDRRLLTTVLADLYFIGEPLLLMPDITFSSPGTIYEYRFRYSISAHASISLDTSNTPLVLTTDPTHGDRILAGAAPAATYQSVLRTMTYWPAIENLIQVV